MPTATHLPLFVHEADGVREITKIRKVGGLETFEAHGATFVLTRAEKILRGEHEGGYIARELIAVPTEKAKKEDIEAARQVDQLRVTSKPMWLRKPREYRDYLFMPGDGPRAQRRHPSLADCADYAREVATPDPEILFQL